MLVGRRVGESGCNGVECVVVVLVSASPASAESAEDRSAHVLQYQQTSSKQSVQAVVLEGGRNGKMVCGWS